MIDNKESLDDTIANEFEEKITKVSKLIQKNKKTFVMKFKKKN